MAKTKLFKNGKNDDFAAKTMEFGQKLVDIRGIAADFLRKQRNALTR